MDSYRVGDSEEAFVRYFLRGRTVETELIPVSDGDKNESLLYLSREGFYGWYNYRFNNSDYHSDISTSLETESGSKSIRIKPSNCSATYNPDLGAQLKRSFGADILRKVEPGDGEEPLIYSIEIQDYFLDKTLFFDPREVLRRSTNLNDNNGNIQFLSKLVPKLGTGEGSKVVLEGLMRARGLREKEAVPSFHLSHPVDFNSLSLLSNLSVANGHHSNWWPSLNDNSIANLLECSQATILAASYKGHHWGLNELGKDRTLML